MTGLWASLTFYLWGVTHFKQKRAVRLARCVQERECPRVRGGGVRVELVEPQCKRDGNAVQFMYLYESIRTSRSFVTFCSGPGQQYRCSSLASCKPIHMMAYPSGTNIPRAPTRKVLSSGNPTEFTPVINVLRCVRNNTPPPPPVTSGTCTAAAPTPTNVPPSTVVPVCGEPIQFQTVPLLVNVVIAS